MWSVYVTDRKIYFNTYTYIFIWDIQKKKFKVIRGKNDFHMMFFVNGKIYEREWEKGLEVLEGDSLVTVDGGEKFATERIYVMLPFPGEKNTILVGTYSMGLFKYDGIKFIPFKTEADRLIKSNGLYRSAKLLSDGNILLLTINGGAVVIDTTGREVRKYNRKNGII